MRHACTLVIYQPNHSAHAITPTSSRHQPLTNTSDVFYLTITLVEEFYKEVMLAKTERYTYDGGQNNGNVTVLLVSPNPNAHE